MEKKISVVFVTEKLEKEFEKLSLERDLKKYLLRAITDLKQNPFCGLKINQKFFPKEYLKKYNINNLWKYDLPGGWRLIYTLVNETKIELLTVILEWFNHKDYEKRFNYSFI
jgi:mRNA-degrading endonuclease RelE of RelBE toxin-antitoxin system